MSNIIFGSSGHRQEIFKDGLPHQQYFYLLFESIIFLLITLLLETFLVAVSLEVYSVSWTDRCYDATILNDFFLTIVQIYLEGRAKVMYQVLSIIATCARNERCALVNL